MYYILKVDNSEKYHSSHILHGGAPAQRWGVSMRAAHVHPRAGMHVVLEVALAAQLGAICCRRHRGGADPGARGAARQAASLHKVIPFT
jgi:hypothetical protein